jgi:hypothetical protein
MRIYEGSPRQDFEEVFRSIGAFLDQRGMKDVLLVEAPDGFIVQGLVLAGGSGGAWSESIGSQVKETLTFLDDDIARFMEEAAALPDDLARDAVDRAIRDATSAGIAGPALTPWLLARIAAVTDGRSVAANTALIVNDARVAAQLAASLPMQRA